MAKVVNRNPFLLALFAPLYQLVGTVAVTNDFLLAAIFLMFTLGLLGAYVTEFPIFPGLYANEVLHKVAVSSLFGFLFGLILFAFSMMFKTTNEDADSSPISPAGEFFLTWVALSIPAYIIMAFLMRGVNKRDLEEEDRIRKEKKKKRKNSGPPIMDRDGF